MEEEKIIEKIKALEEAKAKALVYKDLAELVGKYGEKLNRQISDARRRYERLKKSGASGKALHEALEQETILTYKSLEAQDVRVGMLQKAIKLMEDLDKTQEEFNAFAEQMEGEVQ